MPATNKLTPEELVEFQTLRNEIYETISILGDLNYRKTIIDFEIDNLKDRIKANSEKEVTLLQKFGGKYGNGSINAETGEITSL